MTNSTLNSDKGDRFPAEIISCLALLHLCVELARRFKSPGQAQRFLLAFELIRTHFHPKQHQLTAHRDRQQLRQRFQDWREVAHLKSAA